MVADISGRINENQSGLWFFPRGLGIVRIRMAFRGDPIVFVQPFAKVDSFATKGAKREIRPLGPGLKIHGL